MDLSFLPESWLPIVTCVIAIFAAVAVVLPAPSEKSPAFYRFCYRFVQWIALNFGEAKNAADSNSKNLRL